MEQITSNTDNFLNNYFFKKRILFIETTLRTLPFTKVLLKSSGSSISEKIHLVCQISTKITISSNSKNRKIYQSESTKSQNLCCRKIEGTMQAFLSVISRTKIIKESNILK